MASKPQHVRQFQSFSEASNFLWSIAEGGPLVLSRRAALPEVGGDAALYFDPTDPLSLAAAVSDASSPETDRRLRAAARAQREKFRWRRAAREVVDHYLS